VEISDGKTYRAIKFAYKNAELWDDRYLKFFIRNPDCHFWSLKEKGRTKALLIGELKYGKLEVYRFYCPFHNDRQIFKFAINFFIRDQNVCGITVFQNLRKYFDLLEKIDFKYDADIEMELDLHTFKSCQSSLNLEFESLKRRHRRIVHLLKKLCYTNDFYQRLVCKDCLDEYIKDSIDAIYKDEDSNRFIVKEKNKIIGFVMWTEKKIPEIIDVMVLPERQNKGYGRTILDKVLTELKSKGFRKVRLGVFKSNLSALYLYEKIGFKPIQMIIAMFLYRNLKNSYTADKENFIIEKDKIHQGHS